MSDHRLRTAERAARDDPSALNPRKLARAGRLNELSTKQLEKASLVIPERLALARRVAGEWEGPVDTRRALLMEALDLIGRPSIVRWGAECATRVLPIWEQGCPDDRRPRRAIEAARAWAACPCEEHREAAWAADADAAADAAAGAARAAAWAAARAAARAARATAGAARAAAWATDEAAWAARAAARAAKATWALDKAATTADEEHLWQADWLRRYLLDPRPFPGYEG